jgi:hypothetical protein
MYRIRQTPGILAIGCPVLRQLYPMSIVEGEADEDVESYNLREQAETRTETRCMNECHIRLNPVKLRWL